MSLLWTQAAAIQKSAMPWFNNNDGVDPSKARSVRSAGYAGYVDHEEPYRGEDDTHGKFDEKLWEDSTPTPTDEEQDHYDRHGDYPDSYHERHDDAYGTAKAHKEAEDEPDIHDSHLINFLAERGHDNALWQSKGSLTKVPLTGPVYATQSHVNQTHIDRYKAKPGDDSWASQRMGPKYHEIRQHDPYLADDTPMFVTHQGRLHVTDGHHRVAAALQSGQPHIHAWHYDLDKHPVKLEDDDWD